jgi:hypothetical protein
MSGDDKIKGYAPRLVTIPGYHIHPQWDLIHTRSIITERRAKKKYFSLSLAPMVDMFSILVIYLLMNFSSSGEAFFVSKDIVIPKAIKGHPMKSFPLISIVGANIVFEADEIEGEAVPVVSEVNDGQVPKLRAMLKHIRTVEEQIGGPSGFRGQVNIQSDEKTPIDEVKKIMRVLVDENWTGINFIVDPSTT